MVGFVELVLHNLSCPSFLLSVAHAAHSLPPFLPLMQVALMLGERDLLATPRGFATTVRSRTLYSRLSVSPTKSITGVWCAFRDSTRYLIFESLEQRLK
jgi:hypothetical protein